MKERINKLEQDVVNALERGVADAEKRQEALDILDEVEDIAARLSRDEPFQRYLQEQLRSERKAYQDGDREDPLCGCSYPRCDLKLGRVPGLVKQAPSTQAGIDDFQSRHPQADVLLDIRESWTDDISEYRQALREALNIIDPPSELTIS
jgi:hypothetical protein